MEIQKFAVTFGVQYSGQPDAPQHPLGMLGNGYAVVEAPDGERARALAFAAFGEQWSFYYPLDEFLHHPMRSTWHPLGELLRVAWQTPEVRRQAELGESVHDLMNGRPWNADTLEAVSQRAAELGMPFEDVEEAGDFRDGTEAEDTGGY